MAAASFTKQVVSRSAFLGAIASPKDALREQAGVCRAKVSMDAHFCCGPDRPKWLGPFSAQTSSHLKGRALEAVVAAAAAADAEGPAVAPSPDIPRPKKIGKGVVRLRLARLGRKKRPFYRIVATHSSWRRDGKSIEVLGHYNPLHAPNDLGIVVKADRIKYWLGVGAQPSDTVAGILHKVGILKAPAAELSQ